MECKFRKQVYIFRRLNIYNIMRDSEVLIYCFSILHMMQDKEVMTTIDVVLCFLILVEPYQFRKCSLPIVNKQTIL
jgi:hypothetical protein